jgi:hypothetical protein
MTQTIIRKTIFWSLAILLTIGAMAGIVWNGTHPSDAVRRQQQKLSPLPQPAK